MSFKRSHISCDGSWLFVRCIALMALITSLYIIMVKWVFLVWPSEKASFVVCCSWEQSWRRRGQLEEQFLSIKGCWEFNYLSCEVFQGCGQLVGVIMHGRESERERETDRETEGERESERAKGGECSSWREKDKKGKKKAKLVSCPPQVQDILDWPMTHPCWGAALRPLRSSQLLNNTSPDKFPLLSFCLQSVSVHQEVLQT